MNIKEIFSFDNISRIHREMEQLKDAFREMRGHTIPMLLKENADLKEEVKQLKSFIVKQKEETSEKYSEKAQ